MKKKVLATLLALCMLMSLLPAAAFAADAEESEAVSVEETVSEPVEEPAESEPAEAPAESEPAEETAPAEEPEIDTGIGFGFGPIISIEELKDQGFVPEDYTSEEPAESEDADVETGLAEEPVIQDEDILDDNDAEDAAPAEDEEPGILEEFFAVAEAPEDAGADDEYAIATMSAFTTTIKGEGDQEKDLTKVDKGYLYDHGKKEDGTEKGEVKIPEDGYYDITQGETHKEIIKGADGEVEKEVTVQDVTLVAVNVPAHDKAGSGEGTNGKWAGVGFVPADQTIFSNAGDGGAKIKAVAAYGKDDGTMPDALKTLGEKSVEDNVNGSDKGYAIYIDTNENTHKYLWVAIQWTEDGPTEYYRIAIDLTGDSLKDPETPDEPGTDKPKPEPNVPEVDDSGDSDSTPATPPIKTAGDTTTASVTAVSSTNGTTASAELSSSKLDAAISSALTEAAKRGTNPEVKIELRTSEKADSLNVTLPTASLKTLADAKGSSLAVASGVAGVKLDHTALSALASQAAGRTITLVVTPVASYSLTEAQKAAVGKAPVVNLAFLSDGVAIQDYGSGTITVSLAYTPAGGQAASDVAVYYLGDSGSMTPRSTTYHDGQVTFITTHLGRYVIGTAK